MSQSNKQYMKKMQDRKVRIALKMLDDGRECGACKACCTVMAVEPIGKPYFEPCKHLDESGCGIYARRPGECKAWSCLWRWGAHIKHMLPGMDALGDEFRPDECGIMFERRPRAAYELVGLVKPEVKEVIQAFELRPDSADAHPDIMERLSQHLPVIVIAPDKSARVWGVSHVTIRPIDWTAL